MSAMLASEVWPGSNLAAGPAKFVAPGLPRHWIRRDRLHRQLSLAVQSPLTVISAPPGSGKTVLLSDWAQGRPDGDVAWFTVEEADNRAEVFWAHVLIALGMYGEEIQDGGRARVGSTPWLESMSRRLKARKSCVLVLDDFHLITNDAIVDSLVLLIRHLPLRVRVVLAGKSAPALPVRWLLLTGQATAITEADLRFTVEECGALAAMVAGQFLQADQLATLVERCEGWATGLHLAALAIGGDGDPSDCIRRFSGSFGPVAEYLEHAVLGPESPDLVRFMLQMSVLDRFTPALCQAVTGRVDAAEILQALSNRNLFVAAVGSEEPVYRYHHLLADLLRSRLELEDSSLARTAHLNAGTWFESGGDARSAAHEFAQAEAYDRAFVLAFSDLLHPLDGGARAGDDSALLSVGEPGPEVEGDPARTYIYAAALLCSQRIAEAAPVLRRLDSLTAADRDRRLWRARVEFLWAVHAERLADASSLLDHCRSVSELLPPAGASEAQEGAVSSWSATIDSAMAAHVPVLAARAHVWLEQPDQAQAILVDHFGTEEAAEASQPATLALIACRQGRLRTAYHLASTALTRAEGRGRADDLATLDARLALAEVLFEQDELEAAEEQLEAAQRLCRSVGGTHWEWAIDIDMVRLMVARGRSGEALNRLGHLRHLEGRQPPAHHLLQKLNYVEILCRISLGDLEGTLLVARSMAPDIAREALARIDLFSGRPDRALSRLAAGPLPKAGAEIRRLILLACAELQRGRTQLAEDAMVRAVEAGRPDGFLRPFLEEAAQILPLLRGLAPSYPDLYVTHLVCHAEEAVPIREGAEHTTVLEPLTDRERELLGYLPSHLHMREIADRMYVSLNTVKTHLKNIYRKLGATSRSEAVSIARAHGLV